MTNSIKSTTLTLSQHKGGVGKSTITINLSYYLGKLGYKVLVVDLDPQRNTSNHIGFLLDHETEFSVANVLQDHNFDIYKAIQTKTEFENVHLLPSKETLTSTQYFLKSESPVPNEILDLSLSKIKNEYDFILIDCPPSFETLVFNALVTTDIIISPIDSSYSLDGFVKIIKALDMLSRLNPNIKFLAPVLNSQNGTNVDKYSQEKAVEIFKSDLFKGRVYSYEPIIIKHSAPVRETAFTKQSVFQVLRKSSPVRTAFTNLGDLLVQYHKERQV